MERLLRLSCGSSPPVLSAQPSGAASGDQLVTLCPVQLPGLGRRAGSCPPPAAAALKDGSPVSSPCAAPAVLAPLGSCCGGRNQGQLSAPSLFLLEKESRPQDQQCPQQCPEVHRSRRRSQKPADSEVDPSFRSRL